MLLGGRWNVAPLRPPRCLSARWLRRWGAQIAARRLKMIATVFVTIAILPLVPGVGLYRAMSALATGDMMAGASIAAHTMALILMIALGIGLGTALVGADRGAKH